MRSLFEYKDQTTKRWLCIYASTQQW